MRITVLILGLVACLWISFEAFLAFSIFNATGSDPEATATAVGFMAGLLGIVGAALVIAFPLASSVIFVLAGLFSIGAAAEGYPNHQVYLWGFFLLAIMSFFGWRGKKKEIREKSEELQRQRDRDERLELMMQHQHEAQRKSGDRQEVRAGGPFCTSCGVQNAPDSNFCGECGAAM